MAINDEVNALKALVTKIITEKRAWLQEPYNPGTSPEWERRKRLAKRMLAIHLRISAARRPTMLHNC
jgi:hypothetical protein